MTREDINNIIRALCPNDDDFEKPIISPAYLKTELEALALEQKPCGDAISREVYTQVMRERDIAIEQLHELGYEWGQKIEPCGDAISRQAAFNAFGLSEKSRKYGGDHSGYDTLMKYEIQDVLENLPPVTPEPQPCGNAIDRAEAIKIASGYCHPANVAKELAKLPPVTPQAMWIPASEKLPEDRREVLVTAYWHETYQVMMASYYGDGLWWCVPFNNCGEHMQRLKPKAWMPLPEPYKPD